MVGLGRHSEIVSEIRGQIGAIYNLAAACKSSDAQMFTLEFAQKLYLRLDRESPLLGHSKRLAKNSSYIKFQTKTYLETITICGVRLGGYI